MKNTVTLVHFRDKCIGCGSCADLAPEHWAISNSDGRATLKGSRKKNRAFVKAIDKFDSEENIQAAGACPVNIIQVNQKIESSILT